MSFIVPSVQESGSICGDGVNADKRTLILAWFPQRWDFISFHCFTNDGLIINIHQGGEHSTWGSRRPAWRWELCLSFVWFLVVCNSWFITKWEVCGSEKRKAHECEHEFQYQRLTVAKTGALWITQGFLAVPERST